MENIIDPSVARERMLQVDSSEGTEASNKARPGWKCPFLVNWPLKSSLIITISILLIILIGVGISFRERGRKTSAQSSLDVHLFVPDGPSCPSDWVDSEKKCYFFSNEERNWASCQSFCASHNSSLAVIKNEPEKVFMLRYKGTAGHWIGLKKDLDHTWKWVDGTELNNMLEVKEQGGDCAFLSSGYATSSQCHVTRRWICRRPEI